MLLRKSAALTAAVAAASAAGGRHVKHKIARMENRAKRRFGFITTLTESN
jgi:hypothetical protein